jgi:PAS domain S-box-containing protein
MKFYFNRKVLIGFIAAMTITAWLAVSAFLHSKQYKENAQWVSHTNEVLYHSARLLSIITSSENAQRGYFITGDTLFLHRYERTVISITEHLDQLKHLTADNPLQNARVDSMRDYISIRIKNNEDILAKPFTSISNDAVVITKAGRDFMRQATARISRFQAAENELLEKRVRITERRFERFNTTFTMLLVATGFILLLLFIFLHFNLKARAEAEQSLRAASAQIQDIYDHAPCGYHSINSEGVFEEINQTLLQWIQYSKEEVIGKLKFSDLLVPESLNKFQMTFPQFKERGFVNNLEFELARRDGTVFPILLNATAVYNKNGEFVKSRTTIYDYSERKRAEEKIRQLNHELEAFSYSVSHDLRAPLRSIDGYTRILAEDYADKIGQDGNKILTTIINSAWRMGKLIDDLLDFSRISRKELTKSRIDTNDLVRQVVREVMEGKKEERIDVRMTELPNCVGDPDLIRQVWINLISNAIKYSGKKEKSVIEIQAENKTTEIVFSVKDNGTGFDMQYVSKLFGVFQRLHRQQDFEGTGVGLAIVKRIVTRHGGNVWAEAAVGEGATFYFSLPHESDLNP